MSNDQGFFCPVPTSVVWTPDNYEYSYEQYDPEEPSSSTTAYAENPDWYYTEDGRSRCRLGGPSWEKGSAPGREFMCGHMQGSRSLPF